MSGLINPELLTARKSETRDQTIALILCRLAGNLVFLQFCHEQVHLVAQKGAIGFRVLAVGDGVRAGNRATSTGRVNQSSS